MKVKSIPIELNKELDKIIAQARFNRNLPTSFYRGRIKALLTKFHILEGGSKGESKEHTD